MTTIFTKIIKGEIPSEKVYESDNVLAFKDINPQAPIHILIIPKKEIPNIQALGEEDGDTLLEMISVAQDLARKFGIQDGYRLLTNNGKLAGQTVAHLHFHLIGGRKLAGELG